MATGLAQTIPTDSPTFVIGDCHGNLPRLEALLEQESLINHADRDDVTVVQLGDLGHFGNGSQFNDRATWEYGIKHLDYVLWGNHDRATFFPHHYFSGYEPAFGETRMMMNRLEREGRLLLALEAHDFLLTHAGLHAAFKHQYVDSEIKKTASATANWLNNCNLMNDPPDSFVGVRDAISWARGGAATAGGILWRDTREKLYDGFRQVFGHTRGDKVRKYQTKAGISYCIDVGTPTNGRLAGIWLPEERIVEVKV